MKTNLCQCITAPPRGSILVLVSLLVALPCLAFTSDTSEAQELIPSVSVSGRFTVEASLYLAHPGAVTSAPGISQTLEFDVNGTASRTVGFFLSGRSRGYWGVGMPSDGSYGMPATYELPVIDQAYLTYDSDAVSVACGRIRPALDPGGLLLSGAVPIEGVLATAAVPAFGRAVTVSGLLARLSSYYPDGAEEVAAADDLVALRAELTSGPPLGVTVVASELADSRVLALDAATRLFGRDVDFELAFYSPSPTFVDVDSPGLYLGGLLKVNAVRGPQQSLDVSAGWFDRGFTPVFSKLLYPSPGGLVWFAPGTAGLVADFERRLAPDLLLVSSAAVLTATEPGAPGLEVQEQADRADEAGDDPGTGQSTPTPLTGLSLGVSKYLDRGHASEVNATLYYVSDRVSGSYVRLCVGWSAGF